MVRGYRHRSTLTPVASGALDWLFNDQPPPMELPTLDTRFIPLRPNALARAIAASPDVFGPACTRASEVMKAIDRVIDQEVTALHAHIDELYEALNPDSDTPHRGLSARAEDRGERELLRALAYVLDKANYDDLSEAQITKAIEAGTALGVRVSVDPSKVEHLSLHVRGLGEVPVSRRRRFRPWKTVTHEEPVYRRLAVVVRLTGETGIRLKLFRDIPVRDVEALLPHAEVKMSLFDRVQVFGGGVGALGGVAAKIFTAITTGVFALTALAWALTIGLGGLAIRSFFGYRRTKKLRSNQRTAHLYDRNLANNASVLHALVRMIHQEEVKEATLAYMFLASPETPTTCDEDIDRAAEAWLRDACGRDVNFDCPDALETLSRLGLLDSDGREVIDPERALSTLDDHWRRRASERCHLDFEGCGGRSRRKNTAAAHD